MNTAIAFVTNTNWQWYAGEATLSNLSQMLALALHNFLSAATGIAVAFALFRGFARRETKPRSATSGPIITRITLYLLVPACDRLRRRTSIWAGVPQTLASWRRCDDAGGRAADDRAGSGCQSQEAIKMLGTNGGGFFNANSAHPFENPSAVTNHGPDGVDLRPGRRPHLDLRQGGQATRGRVGQSWPP